MSEVELVPCPFCGGEVKLKELQFWAWLTCEGCGARYENDRHAMGDKFVEAWNRRVPGTCTWNPVDDYDYWEGDCGSSWFFNDGRPSDNDMNYCPSCGRKLVEYGE